MKRNKMKKKKKRKKKKRNKKKKKKKGKQRWFSNDYGYIEEDKEEEIGEREKK